MTFVKMFTNIIVTYAPIQKVIPAYMRYLVTLSGENMRRYSSSSDSLTQSIVGGRMMLLYLPSCIFVSALSDNGSCLRIYLEYGGDFR